MDAQIHARDIIEAKFNNVYNTNLNLLSNTPQWFLNIKANPMHLGLDLRGGVNFLLEVDTHAVIDKTLDKYSGDIRRILRNNIIKFGDISNDNNNIISIQFRDANSQNNAYSILNKELKELVIIKNNPNNDSNNPNKFNIQISISNNEIQKLQDLAIKQNITILHNRVNELGVSEPVIQQQGANRISVELPGIQDPQRAKQIIGRIATLEVHLVNDNNFNNSNNPDGLDNFQLTTNNINVPLGYELLTDNSKNLNSKILIKQDTELTGDNIIDAQTGFDDTGKPAVNLRLDNFGASLFKQLTHDNIGKRLAMVLVDHGNKQVITAPVINSEIGGGQVQISGSMDIDQANDIALLLRSGSLAAPMNIIQERTIGPTLGAQNIVKGFHSVLWGFVAIAGFMIIYYLIFGIIAVISLSINLLLLIAGLSVLQATLTLPGIAAIALTLGMAIDSNVLINERIREELKNNSNNLYEAIELGYKHAWATILDSNITTLIAGLALLAFGSGSIKGFAVVHCMGIVSSMFSAVFVSRGIVALIYAKNKIKKLYIG